MLFSIQDTKPAGSIQIKGASVTSVPKKDCGKEHCFSITTADRTFLLYADSENEKDDWINQITRTLQE